MLVKNDINMRYFFACKHHPTNMSAITARHFRNACIVNDLVAVTDIINNSNISLESLITRDIINDLMYKTKSESILKLILNTMISNDIFEINSEFVSWFGQTQNIMDWDEILFCAIKSGWIECANIILDKCASVLYFRFTDPEQKNSEINAFMLAIKNEMSDIALKISDIIINFDFDGDHDEFYDYIESMLGNNGSKSVNPFLLACKHGPDELIQKLADQLELFSNGLTVRDPDGYCCINYLICKQKTDIVLKCLEYIKHDENLGPDGVADFINTDRESLFTFACRECFDSSIPIAMLDIDGVDVYSMTTNKDDDCEYYPIELAVRNKNCDMKPVIERLIKRNIFDGDTLQAANEYGHIDIIIKCLTELKNNQTMCECPVCFRTVVGVSLACTHFICRSCKDSLNVQKCPLCRAEF